MASDWDQTHPPVIHKRFTFPHIIFKIILPLLPAVGAVAVVVVPEEEGE